MRKMITHIGLLITTMLLAVTGAAHAQDDVQGTLTVDGLERAYTLHIPVGYESSTPAPLVILLHGATMNGVSMMLASEFNAAADEAGALVVYPNSRGPRWMYLDEDETPADEDYHDDIAFIGALIDHLSENYAVDATRVYVAGYSSGGMMTLRLRCALPDRIAAFAVIAANFSYDLALHCLESGPASVLVVIGTRDTPFPMLGYAAVTPSGELDSIFSLNQQLTFLSTLNQCAQDVTQADVSTPTGAVQVLRHTYPTCADETQVKLYALINWDHDWPGRTPVILEQNGQEGTIRDAIWEFFDAHRLPE